MIALLGALLDSILDSAPPLVFAALGAVISERAGIVNVGVEGMMRAGALGAAVAALVVPTPVGVLAGILCGAALGLLHGSLTVLGRSDHVVSGIAINVVMLALGSFILESVFGSPSTTPGITPMPRVLGYTAFTWLAFVAPLVVHGVLAFTPWGLRIRAVGEKPQAVAVTGVRVEPLRLSAVTLSGALAGLGGAALSTGALDRFEHHMPSGMGFMAIAAMVFGRWRPLHAAGAACFFAFGQALRLGLASSAPGLLEVVPSGVMLALPYLLTLTVLALSPPSRTSAPAALGQPHDVERR